MLVSPFFAPAEVARYLAAPVWLGFIFLLEPINQRLGGESLLLETGPAHRRLDRVINLSFSGLLCGVLWEFWNYWAQAKWVYVFPIGQGTKVFEMPLAGFLGFPVFAVECLMMFEFVGTIRRVSSKGRDEKAWPAVAPES